MTYWQRLLIFFLIIFTIVTTIHVLNYFIYGEALIQQFWNDGFHWFGGYLACIAWDHLFKDTD